MEAELSTPKSLKSFLRFAKNQKLALEQPKSQTLAFVGKILANKLPQSSKFSL